MEFIVTNRSFELPAQISNIEELRQTLVPKLAFYNSLVVTENSIKSAKSDKAALNKLKKAIDEKRKEIKKAYLEPYQAIEDECKKLIAMIDEPVQAIDRQLKVFEDAEIQAKRAVLEDAFNEENTLDFLLLDDVINPKWKNKTEKTENLIEEIKSKILKFKSDFEYLKNMYSDSSLFPAVLTKFQETKSRELTLAYAVELERSEKSLNAVRTDCNASNIITPVSIHAPVKNDSDGDRVLSGTFKVTCTVSELKALRDFMKENGINFEVVE